MRFQRFAAVLASIILVALPLPAAAETATDAATVSTVQVLPVSFSVTSRDELNGAEVASAAAPALDAEGAKWRATRDKALKWEMAYLALSAIDAVQTIECLEREACDEANPLFGKDPSIAKILLLKGGLGLGHFLIFTELNKRNPKSALRAAQVSAGIQGAFVVLNARMMF